MARTPTATEPKRPTVKRTSSQQAALKVPAPYITTTIVMRGTNVVRLAFGESVGGETVFHAAVAMSVESAEGLCESIKAALAKAKAKEKTKAGPKASSDVASSDTGHA